MGRLLSALVALCLLVVPVAAENVTNLNSGLSLPISGNGVTVTVSTPLLNLTQTWNAGAVTFTALKLNVTATASAAASLLLDLQVASASVLKVVKSGQLLGVDGAAATPTYSFANETNTGMTLTSAGILGFDVGGTRYLDVRASGVYIPADNVPLIFGNSADTKLNRDAANTLALRNGATAQTFNVYNTFTDASNNEYLRVGWAGNTAFLNTIANGTGVIRPLSIYASVVQVLAPLTFVTDNTYDIGASGATRPRNGYFGTSLYTRATISTGTVPTLVLAGGTCAGTVIAGGSTVGTVTLTGVCVATNTMTLSVMPTVTTGYVCDAVDRTLGSSLLTQTATSTTTVTFTFGGTTGATDVLAYKCLAY